MRSLYKNLSIYGIGNILSKSINILLVPVYTAYLAVESFGILELINMVAAISLMFFCFNISSGYIRKYFDEDSKGSAFSTAFWFSLSSSLFMCLLFLYFAEFFSVHIFDFSNGKFLFRLIITATAIHAVSISLYSHLQVRQKAFMYMMISIITLISTIGITISFVVVFDLGLEGILYAKLIGALLEFLMLILVSGREISISFSGSFILDMLKFSAPLIPGQLAAFLLNYSDRVFLKEFKTLEDVGVYSLGYKISSILLILTVFPITRAFGPYIFSLIKSPGQLKDSFRRFMRYYLMFALSMALFLSLFSKELIMVLANENYINAQYIVYLLCISYVFYGLHAITSFVFHIIKKTWIMSIIMAGAAIINIILNYFLVPEYGIVGASIATMTSFFIVLTVKFAVIRLLYPIGFNYAGYISIFMASGLVYAGSYYLTSFIFKGFYQGIFLKVLMLIIFVIFAIGSRFIRRAEIASFVQFFIDYSRKYLGSMRRQ